MPSDLTAYETLDQSLLALARMLFTGQTTEETLDSVANLAQRTIPGCDGASVTLMENGRPRTTVSTDPVATIVDQHQYDNDDGPCLHAMRSAEVVRVDSFEHETRWPNVMRAAIERGVHSSLSLPLVAVQEPVGALNLYGMQQSAFAQAEETAGAFARQAAITLTNAAAFHRATDLALNLRIALERRDVIGQAKGILMAAHDISAEEAFELLRQASQRRNRKLFDLASDVVERREIDFS